MPLMPARVFMPPIASFISPPLSPLARRMPPLMPLITPAVFAAFARAWR
jgi:hypothetical protein